MSFEDKSTFNLIVIPNPFELDKRKEILAPFENKTLKQLFSQTKHELAVSINGREITNEMYATETPQVGDTVVISAIPRGGDDGKSILRLVAIVALTYVSGGIASGSIGGLTGGAATAAAAAVQIGGTLLINALLPPAMPSIEGFKMDNQDSPTYGVDGAKNTSVEGISVPIAYGSHRMAGNIIGLYTENKENDQWLYMLVNAGEGEIDSISDIELNDQPIGNFNDVTILTRLGTADQEAIPWFNKSIVPKSVAQTVSIDPIVFNTAEVVDELRVDVTFPSGLLTVDQKTGKKATRSVVIHASATSASDPNIVHTQSITVSEKTSSAVRRSIYFEDLQQGLYIVNVWRDTNQSSSSYISDSVVVTDINEIQTEKVRYKHTALLALKIRMSDQLNGIPNLSFVNNGIKVKTFENGVWTTQASSSPAWGVYDILTKKRYGGGIAESQIDVAAFKRWAKMCDANGLTFDAVLDTTENLYDIIQPILRAGHAKLVLIGSRFSIVAEEAAEPVMMFSQQNIIKDTLAIEWLGLADRANEVQVTFYDKENKNKPKTIRLQDQASILRGDMQRLASMTLLGVTSEVIAYREATLALNINKMVRQTISFDAAIHAIGCTLGSVILVQHEMPEWGYGGKILEGSTRNALSVDIDVFDSTHVSVMKSALKRSEATVNNISDDVVYLSGFSGESRVRQLKSDTVNYAQVLEYTEHVTFGFGIRVMSAEDFSVGQTVELWDTDVIYESTFTKSEDGTLSLNSPLPFDPDINTQFVAGTVGMYKKPFRITAISNSESFVRTISAIEYNDAIYDTNGDYSPIISSNDSGSLTHSVILGVDEETVLVQGAYFTRVTVNFVNGSGIYNDSLVYVSKDGSPYVNVGNGVNLVKFDAEAGQELVIRVVARGIDGSEKYYVSAPVISYVVKGNIVIPDKPLSVNVTGGGLIFDTFDCPISWTVTEPSPKYIVVVNNGVSNWVQETTNTTITYPYSANKEKSRILNVSVSAVSTAGQASEPVTAVLQNPGPALPEFSVFPEINGIRFAMMSMTGANSPGIKVWVSTTSPVVKSNSPNYIGNGGHFAVSGLEAASTYYYIVESYDLFGPSESSVQASVSTKNDILLELTSSIERIDGDANTAGSIAQQVSASAQESANALSQYAQTVSDNFVDEAVARNQAIIDKVSEEAVARGAAIGAERTVRVNAEEAISSEVDILKTTVNNPTTGVAATAQLLSEKIVVIDTVNDKIGTHTGRLDAMEASLNELSVADFDPNKVYELNDLFRYNGAFYEVVSIPPSQPNPTPPNVTYYTERNDVNSLSDLVSANAGAIESMDIRLGATETTANAAANAVTNLNTAIAGKAESSTVDLISQQVNLNKDDIISVTDRVTTTENRIGSVNQLTVDPAFINGAEFLTGASSGEIVPDATHESVNVAGGLQITGSSWWFTKTAIPIDMSRTYRVRFQVEQTVDSTTGSTSRVYAGVATLDENFINLTGGAGTHRYCAVSGYNIVVANGVKTFEGEISGEGENHDNFRPGTRYVRPMFIVNYSGGDGTVIVKNLTFEDITDVKVAAAALSAVNSRLEDAEGTISGHVTDISNLNVAIGDKVGSSAFDALETRVETEEGKSSSASTAITNLTNSLETVKKTGANLLVDGSFLRPEGEEWDSTSGGSIVNEGPNGERCLRLNATGANYGVACKNRIKIKPGDTYVLSGQVYLSSDYNGTAFRIEEIKRDINNANVTEPGENWKDYVHTNDLTVGQWVSFERALTNNSATGTDLMIQPYMSGNTTAGYVLVANLHWSKAVSWEHGVAGVGKPASGADVTATSAAHTDLKSRVDQHDDDFISQSEDTTLLRNEIRIAIDAEVIIPNGNFADWSDIAPNNWVKWGTTTLTKEENITIASANAIRFINTSTITAGVYSTPNVTDRAEIDYIDFEVDVYLVSGSFTGAGARLDWHGTTNAYAWINFTNELPLETGKWHTVKATLKKPDTLVGFTGYRVYLFGNYSGGGLGAQTNKDIIFGRVKVTPSSQSVIDSIIQSAALDTLSSQVNHSETGNAALSTKTTLLQGSIETVPYEQTRRWSRDYGPIPALGSTPLLWYNGASLPNTINGNSGGRSEFVFTAVTLGTGGITQTIGKFSYDGTNWQYEPLQKLGAFSDADFLLVGGVPHVKNTNGSTAYTVRVQGEDAKSSGGVTTTSAKAIDTLKVDVSDLDGVVQGHVEKLTQLEGRIQGINLLPAEYASFNGLVALPVMTKGANITLALYTGEYAIAGSNQNLRLQADGLDAYAFFATGFGHTNVPITGGDTYIISAWVYIHPTGSPVTTNNVLLTSRQLKKDGSFDGYSGSNQSVSIGSEQRIKQVFVAKSSSVGCTVRIDLKAWSGNGPVYMTVDKVMIERVSAGQTEPSPWVPGITTAAIQQKMRLDVAKSMATWGVKIDAGGRISSLQLTDDGTESSIAFSTNNFLLYDAGTANLVIGYSGGQTFIKGAYIDSLDAAKISAANLSAISANMGTVTAGVIRSADSNFKIDLNAKTFLMRKTSTGARTERTEKTTKVYDANNQLRVHIGDLTA